MPYYSTDRLFATNWSLRPFDDVPLPLAVELAELVTEACRWFTEPRSVFLGDPDAPAFDDGTVDEVVTALQCQLDKEGASRTRGSTCSRHGVVHKDWYHLTDLPAARKRALVERVWALKQQAGVTVRVWNEGDAPPTAPILQSIYGPEYGYYGE